MKTTNRAYANISIQWINVLFSRTVLWREDALPSVAGGVFLLHMNQTVTPLHSPPTSFWHLFTNTRSLSPKTHCCPSVRPYGAIRWEKPDQSNFISVSQVYFLPLFPALWYTVWQMNNEIQADCWLLFRFVSILRFVLFFFLSIVLADSVCDCAIRMTHGIVAGSSHLFEGHTFKHGAGKWCLICVFATVYRRGKWLARNSTQRTNKTWSIRRLLPGKIPSNLVWLVFFVKYHASPSIITMRLHLEMIFEQLPLKCLAIQKSFYFTLATHRGCSLQHKNNLHNFQKQLSPTQRK